MTNYNGDDRRKFGRLKNIANIGDIVVVAGYLGREFHVESYSHEIDYQPDYTEEVILYDISDVITGEYALAYQEDVSVIRRSDGDSKTETDEISLNMDYDWVDLSSYLAAGWEWIGGMDFVREEENPMTKTGGKYNKARVDELLVELSDYNDLIKNFGDEDGGYAKKIETIKSTLRYMTGGK